MIYPVTLDHQRGEIGFGEVAVVVSFFLAALRHGHSGRLVPAQRLLHNRLSRLEQGALTGYFVLECPQHSPERVQVLNLGASKQRLVSNGTDRDVRLKANDAFLHVAAVHAQVLQQRSESCGVGLDLFDGC